MKKLLALLLVLALALGAAGCKKNPEQSSSGGNTEDNRLIKVEGLKEDLYPNLKKIDETNLSGSINVNMVFGKTLVGWQAVKEAYERIQPGVAVKLNEDSDGTYTDNVKNAAAQALRGNPQWDIFQGNRLSNISSVAINMSSQLYKENHYAGVEVDDEYAEEGSSKLWRNVLNRDAYQTDKSGSNTACHIMNSESLSTAWFVNKTAMADAAAAGYTGGIPATWDELISLCYYMKQAGYQYPLGLAGDNASVNESQFAWIFRIYGDQYYRDMYDKINYQEGDSAYVEGSYEFEFSLTDPQPENKRGYNPSQTRMWNSLLDEENAYNAGKNLSYVGAKSDKFACFIENLYKIREYLPVNFTTVSFEEIRDAFMTASSKSAPAILLDYTGFGLTFGLENRGFEIDFFDYPAMQCSHDEKHVTTDFVRDVGGNGGYISVMNHPKDAAQNALNIDFVQFFMSPYGQSIYYNALMSKKIAPDGLSTVLDFAIPASWKEFFENDTIQFNGLCDVNWYNNNFIYHVNGLSDTRTAHLNTVHNLFKTGNYASEEEAIRAFQNDWNDAVVSGYNKLCESMNWNKDLWKIPGGTPLI